MNERDTNGNKIKVLKNEEKWFGEYVFEFTLIIVPDYFYDHPSRFIAKLDTILKSGRGALAALLAWRQARNTCCYGRNENRASHLPILVVSRQSINRERNVSAGNPDTIFCEFFIFLGFPTSWKFYKVESGQFTSC